MARSTMATATVWVAVAIALCCCVVSATATSSDSLEIIDLFKLVGDRTFRLKFESDGKYLNAVGTVVNYTNSATDSGTYWQMKPFLDDLDKSVYLYNVATEKYLTYIDPILGQKEGVKVQWLADPIFSRWWFYQANPAGSNRFIIGNTFNQKYVLTPLDSRILNVFNIIIHLDLPTQSFDTI